MVWIKFLIKALVVLLAQFFLIDHVHWLGICHPYIYVYLLIALPIPLSRNLELLFGAALGVLIDVFSNSLGVHLAVCSLIGFLRPFFLSSIQDIERLSGEVSSWLIGDRAFLRMLLIIIPVHHFALFYIEVFALHNFFHTFFEALVSSIITFAVLFIVDRLVKTK